MTRTEYDTIGRVEIPEDKYWGAQTQRSINNFKIGNQKMPSIVVKSLAVVKKAAALTNLELKVISREKTEAICTVCEEIAEGKLDDHFPLLVWQTGSGTHTNMNLNEVISNRAHVLAGNRLGEGKPFLHPNDDVNMSQSSNDIFPTAMHIAAYKTIYETTLPGIKKLRNTLAEKADEFKKIIKTGRTHLMDATPLTLGQEFSAFVEQLDRGLENLNNTIRHLLELAAGGSSVGTGINVPPGYHEMVAAEISSITGYPFKSAPNKFEALSSNDPVVHTSASLRNLSVSLMKIANDIRFLASGPRAGLNELKIPANEPGSSIMPGKVNPTQAEALTMVCAQVIGNDQAIVTGGMQGHFQLNVFKPMMIYNLLNSAQLLGDVCISFNNKCAAGIMPNITVINKNVENSLMLVTALNPYIGYDKAAKIAYKAYNENITLREAAVELGLVTEEQFKEWVNPGKMVWSV